MKRLTSLSLGFLLIAFAAEAKIKLEPPDALPPGVSLAARARLSPMLTRLTAAWLEANNKIDAQASECGQVDENSPKVQPCMAEATAVQTIAHQYRSDLDDYRAKLREAVKAGIDPIAPPPLPKAVEAAIAKAYDHAPPGVNAKVHEGFAAMSARNWVSAKASFQDALSHDPGNRGLEELIALCDSAPTGAPPAADTEPKRSAEQDLALAEQNFKKTQLPKHPEWQEQQVIPAKPAMSAWDRVIEMLNESSVSAERRRRLPYRRNIPPVAVKG